MKTTIEVSDALLEAAKRHARERGTTLRALVEEGLRGVLESAPSAVEFTLRDASVDGNGLHPDLREGGWERIAERTYEGRGG
jgi:Arc/MetJ family transcription regulator